MIRKTIFWMHLISGIISGILIAIMSITGIAIAFEHEILDFFDREVSHAQPTPEHARPLSPDEIVSQFQNSHSDFGATHVEFPSSTEDAVTVSNRKREFVFFDPYTAEMREPQSTKAHDFLHKLEMIHRFLGMDGKNNWEIGRLIMGTANLMFLFLCISGLYLWFPKKWIKRLFKKNLLLNKKARGKARDLNWHHVFGFWSMPILTVLVATGVVISFGWGHNLVFILSGEKPSPHRNFRMLMPQPPQVEVVENSTTNPELYQTIVQSVATQYPDWTGVQIEIAPAPESIAPETIKPLSLYIYTPAPFSTQGMVFSHAHPQTGERYQSTEWADRSTGLKARVWVRFLHTGEAFGVVGKIIASLATAASLVLVYTGFALTYQRFFKRKPSRQKS